MYLLAAWLSPPPSECRHFRMIFPGSPLSSLCWLTTRLDIPILTLWRVIPLATFWRSPWPLPPVLQFHPFSTVYLPSQSTFSSSCHHISIVTGGFPCPHSLPPVTCQFSSVLSVSHMSYLFTAYSHLLLSLGQAYQISDLVFQQQPCFLSAVPSLSHEIWYALSHLFSWVENPILLLCKRPRVESIDELPSCY